jgi:type VI secretion system secreted protein VgrG
MIRRRIHKGLWKPAKCWRAAARAGLLLAQSVVLMAGMPGSGSILGYAESFAILGASGVSNDGRTKIYGNLGVMPGAAVTGFPPGAVFQGLIYLGDPVVREAHPDAFSAYDRLQRLQSLPIASALEGNLGGLRLLPGVYSLDSAARLDGTLRLDAQGADRALFVFQIGSTLKTARKAAVIVLNRGLGDAVYWQVGDSAQLGKGTSFEGSILAHNDIAMDAGARIRCGRAFSLTGRVSMDRNSISTECESPKPISGVVGIYIGQKLREGGPAPPLAEPPVAWSPEPDTFWLAGLSLVLLIAVRFHRGNHPGRA